MLSPLPEERILRVPKDSHVENVKELTLDGHMTPVYKHPIERTQSWESFTRHLQEWICVWDRAEAPTAELATYNPICSQRRTDSPGDEYGQEMIGWGCFEEGATAESFHEPVHALYVSCNEAELKNVRNDGDAVRNKPRYGYAPNTLLEGVSNEEGAMGNVLFLRSVDNRPGMYKRVGMGQITEAGWIRQFRKREKAPFVLV